MRAFLISLGILACSLLPPVAAQEVTRPLPPDRASAAWKLPPGFIATLFAGEPAIVQPIAFTFDDRGRVWVIENLSYPTWKADGTGNDRVTILEDSDGDGKHDKRTVFFDNGVNLSGIEVGFGGVWLTSAPNFLFIPDANGDDRPDGEPKMLLDGWTLEAKHNVVGNLAWGPDGWLYGCHGITNPSLVGKPGTSAEQRQKVSCGVWRYHPVRNEFEVHANGTTNPWGIDWDERGEIFITNCVIKHIFHVPPGAHFVRMFGQDPNPHVYGLIESCADHQHWAGGHWTTARGGEAHNDFGGGHAHSGCMIYLGDNWPAEYRGNAFLLNIHGQRLNRDKLERHGSSYVAKHAPDFAFSKDPWFRGLHAKYGPGGAVYVSDWSDIGECHDAKEEQCDKAGGRIFKISYNTAGAFTNKAGTVAYNRSGDAVRDLALLNDEELVDLQLAKNQWLVRHSRRLLQERASAGKLDVKHVTALRDHVRALNRRFAGSLPWDSETTILHHLWTLHVTGLLDGFTLREAFSAHEPPVRAQAALLSVESRQPSEEVLNALRYHAEQDESPSVRLHIASALQRLPLEQRWPIATALLSHAEDATDHYLPLMYWYAFEPLVPHDPRQAIEWLSRIQIPLVRQYVARRITSLGHEKQPADSASDALLNELLNHLLSASDSVRADVLTGMQDAYRGRRNVPAPSRWREVFVALEESESGRVRDLANELGVQFGDPLLIANLQQLFNQEPPSPLAIRRRALSLLATQRVPAFAATLLKLLQNSELRAEAIRALGAYELQEIPASLVSIYATLTPAERQDSIQTLTARPSFALALLAAIEEKQIPREDVSSLVIRELQALDNKEVTERLSKVWGAIRPASADKKSRIEQLKSQLSAAAQRDADLSRGRVLFAKSCANCHKLFGEGGTIGPELTGAQRHNLDYVLENVVDPAAIVPRDYRVTIFRMDDGRVVQGIVLQETPRTIAVQTPTEQIHLSTDEVEARKESNLSMMPEGLFDRLPASEIQDLIAYLASPQQVPLP